MTVKPSSSTAITPSATAFAPATVANVAVGFDILGFPLETAGDEITVSRTDEAGTVRIDAISGMGTGLSTGQDADEIPKEAARNTATVGLIEMMRDLNLPFGFRVSIRKGIPLSSGMGGSAASAAGALVAANALLDAPLPKEILLKYALLGEYISSGSTHADNLAPCLYGGLILVKSVDPLDLIPIPVPAGITSVVVHPHIRVNTREARQLLRPKIALADHVRQSADLASFISGCYRGDMELIGRSMVDTVIEPQRSRLIPGFGAAKAAAFQHGAIGFSISGSGPSVFAWTATPEEASRVAKAIVQVFERLGMKADAWISPINRDGARIVS